MPRTLGIDHIAIAVEDLDEATRTWRDLLGLRVGPRETVEEQGVEVQMMYAGETRVELMRATRPDSPVGHFLAKRGPGMHHLALAVDDCNSAISAVATGGGRLIDGEPRAGVHGTRVAFLHPKSAGGVLTELVEGGEGPWQTPSSKQSDPE